jgi:hypothetical protein
MLRIHQGLTFFLNFPDKNLSFFPLSKPANRAVMCETLIKLNPWAIYLTPHCDAYTTVGMQPIGGEPRLFAIKIPIGLLRDV